MKIVKLTVENIKKLKAVEITPDGNTVLITGKNAQGKTSVLDSIWLALEGAAAAKTNKKPIRDGEDSAFVTLDLGEFIVTRKWTGAGKSYLSVENTEGAQYKSPQALLDTFVGKLSFDPLAFTSLSDKEQAATLRELVGIDTTALDEKRAELYEARAGWNRQAKDRAGAMKTHPGADLPEDTPTEEISVSELMGELEEAEALKRENDGVRADADTLAGDIAIFDGQVDEASDDITELEDAVEKAIAHKKSVESELTEAKSDLDELLAQEKRLEDPDTADIKARIASADEVNKGVRDRKDFLFVESQKVEAENNADKLTAKVEGIDAEKKELVEKAELPIAGLGFDESGVTFGGVPFAQASSAEQLLVSLTMAMALNPKLRVIRITDGSLLDSESMKLIQKMVEDNDYQLWIEKVDETGTVGVYIEDGRVVEMEKAEAAAS